MGEKRLFLAALAANDKAQGVRRVEDGSASVRVDRRRVEFLAQPIAERQAPAGVELICEVRSDIVQAIVAPGIAGLGEGEEGPSQKKVGKCRAGDRPQAVAK